LQTLIGRTEQEAQRLAAEPHQGCGGAVRDGTVGALLVIGLLLDIGAINARRPDSRQSGNLRTAAYVTSLVRGGGNGRRPTLVGDAQVGVRMTSEELRRKAAHCLRLANGAVPNDVAEGLRRLAEEYEDEAQRLEGATTGGAAPMPALP
jgi:hypothetical protein